MSLNRGRQFREAAPRVQLFESARNVREKSKRLSYRLLLNACTRKSRERFMVSTDYYYGSMIVGVLQKTYTYNTS